MADNYLEKKMSDYRAGRLAAGGSKAGILKSGQTAVTYPPRRIFIAAEGALTLPQLRHALRALKRFGCRVSFNIADATAAEELARATHTGFLPGEPAQALQSALTLHKGLDVVIAPHGALPATEPPAAATWRLVTTGSHPSATIYIPGTMPETMLTAALLYLCHPDAVRVQNLTFT